MNSARSDDEGVSLRTYASNLSNRVSDMSSMGRGGAGRGLASHDSFRGPSHGGGGDDDDGML